MASRFVSGGVIAGDDGDDVKAREHHEPARDSAQWEAVQRDLEAGRRAREESRRAAVEGGEKSLFEILQANKAAKQAAFEEQNRLKNQFRALDEDEIDFLSGVRDDERAEEDRVKRETEERLAGFRKARLLASDATAADSGGDGTNEGGDEAWSGEWTTGIGRKRKREKEKEREKALKGVKRRISVPDDGEKESGSRIGDDGAGPSAREPANDVVKVSTPASDTAPVVSAVAPAKTKGMEPEPEPKPKPTLTLVDYGSDEDDDDD
ncbi:putative NEFA-interacting nuclear protein NIP30 [Xylaria nigripes]|nr:putative NEFA-interacting nuclear protein NIP30 [Xylaria nigripes]